MPRVKRGKNHVKKRRKLHQYAKGYKWGRKSLIRLARTATIKAGANAYAHRRQKKREARRLWQTRINAFVRRYGLSYSRFLNSLKKENVELDRKVLADLAANNPEVMEKVVKEVSGDSLGSAEEAASAPQQPEKQEA